MNLVSTALSWTRSLQGLQEQSRLKFLDELRRILEVDTHEAMKIGDFEKNSEAIKVAGPSSTDMFQDVAVREGVDALILGRGEDAFPPMWEQ